MVLSKIIKEPEPQEGDYKFTYHFAWLPTQVDGYKIWMEKYQKAYTWRVRNRRVYSIAMKKTLYFPNCGGWDLIAAQRIKKLK